MAKRQASDEAATGGGEPQRRRRRSTEVDALILGAARELFGSKGYAGTSSREIARRADVHEPSIYRRFGSKAGLFSAAVLAPFEEAVSTYLHSWEAQRDQPATTEQLVRNFITPLYELVSTHRDLTVALILAFEYDAEPINGEPPSLDLLLRRLDTQAQIETLQRGLHTSDTSKLTVRVATALVIGMGLLSSWLFPDGEAIPTEAEIADEMVRLVTYGVTEVRDRPAPAIGVEMGPVLLTQLLDRLAAAERRAVRAELELERHGHSLPGQSVTLR